MDQNPLPPARASTHPNWANLLLPFALILGLVLLLSLNAGPSSSPAPNNPLEEYLKITARYIAIGAEIAVGLVIGVGVLIGVVNYFRHFFPRGESQVDTTEAIRLRLGRILALGLEFTVASDILRTAVAPTRQDIFKPGRNCVIENLAQLLPGTRD